MSPYSTKARTYLDYNATTPVVAAARAAMIAAMDHVGNPSSVHGEGRAAKAVIEKARGQVAAALGARHQDVIFTSGATEAAALATQGLDLHCGGIEHDAVLACATPDLPVDANGQVTVENPTSSALQFANSETGILQNIPSGLALCDATQAFGKIPLALGWLGCDRALISAHKLGGPKGVGALVVREGLDVEAHIKGGGQEMGRRSGTENLIGIAGFGAAAEAAMQALANGVWDEVAQLRDLLQSRLVEGGADVLFVGQDASRLPNTLCAIAPGWKGETQVMQMDLAGFAISAGSACSSGKVKVSKVLKSMGYNDGDAGCAMRVSLGENTTKDNVERFADAWLASCARWKKRAR